MISDFRREAAENCALLGYYAASGGNLLPTFRHSPSVPPSGFKNQKPVAPIRRFLIPKDGTDRLSRNVDNKLPLLAAQQRRRAQISLLDGTSWKRVMTYWLNSQLVQFVVTVYEGIFGNVEALGPSGPVIRVIRAEGTLSFSTLPLWGQNTGPQRATHRVRKSCSNLPITSVPRTIKNLSLGSVTQAYMGDDQPNDWAEKPTGPG